MANKQMSAGRSAHSTQTPDIQYPAISSIRVLPLEKLGIPLPFRNDPLHLRDRLLQCLPPCQPICHRLLYDLHASIDCCNGADKHWCTSSIIWHQAIVDDKLALNQVILFGDVRTTGLWKKPIPNRCGPPSSTTLGSEWCDSVAVLKKIPARCDAANSSPKPCRTNLPPPGGRLAWPTSMQEQI